MPLFLQKNLLPLALSLFFSYQIPVLANNPSEKLPVEWRNMDTLVYPIQMIVEYHDSDLANEEQELKRNIHKNRSNRKYFQEQLASTYAKLKQNVMSTRHFQQQHIHKDYSHLPMNVLTISNSQQLQELIIDSRVSNVYQDLVVYTNVQQSKSLIEADTAEINLATDGSGSSVVILDTGVNFTHSDFGNCTSPGVPETCRVIVSDDLAPEDNQNDAQGHGSNVAAIVGNIAKGADLIVFDVFDGGSASSSTVIEGINWAIVNQGAYNIASINLSLGGTTKYTSTCSRSRFNPYKTPIANAKNAGILTSAAAGNNAYTDGLALPACSPDAVSVGAVYDSNIGGVTWSTSPNCTDSSTAADKVTCFSNSASFLTLLAPGANITAAGITQAGTSQASPHVAALAAILHSAYPNESVSELENRMITSGDIITDSRNGLEFPRINAWRAVGAINNDLTDALPLEQTNSQILVNTENADKQTGEPNHAGISGGKSAWFSFSTAEAGTLTVDTANSDFDTVLAVYTGVAVDSLTLITDNNDLDVANGPSLVSLAITPDTTYWVAVDDADNVGGALTLNSSFEAGVQVPVLPAWGELIMFIVLSFLMIIFSINSIPGKRKNIT